jgi:hypothetical protein
MGVGSWLSRFSSASCRRTSCASSCWWRWSAAPAGAAVPGQRLARRVPPAALRAGAGRGHAGRAGDSAGDAHPQAQRGLKRPGVAGADLRLPRRAGRVHRLPAAAGAAAGADPHRPAVRLMNALVALWALWLFRHELRRLGAHVLACVLTLGALLARPSPAAAHHHAGRGQASTRTNRLQRRDLALAAHRGHARVQRALRLFLNGNLQFAERDEYRYHEALVHPVMAAHGGARKVAVLGGGDGHGGARAPALSAGGERSRWWSSTRT